MKKVAKSNNSSYIYIGLAVLTGGILMAAGKPKTTRPPVNPIPPLTPGTTNPIKQQTTPVVSPIKSPQYTINRDIILQKGHKSAEVAELQKMLGITADGIFGPQTEKALIDKKGVREISLNKFVSTADMTGGQTNTNLNNGVANSAFSGFKIGDTVKAKLITVAANQTTISAGKILKLNTLARYFSVGETIGKIIQIESFSGDIIVKANNGMNYWVKSVEVYK